MLRKGKNKTKKLMDYKNIFDYVYFYLCEAFGEYSKTFNESVIRRFYRDLLILNEMIQDNWSEDSICRQYHTSYKLFKHYIDDYKDLTDNEKISYNNVMYLFEFLEGKYNLKKRAEIWLKKFD